MADALTKFVIFPLAIASVQFGLAADGVRSEQPGSEPAKPAMASDSATIRTAWHHFRDARPAERGALHPDSYIRDLAAAYHLDATQESMALSELKQIAGDRSAELGPLAVEYDQLANSAAEIWWSHRLAAIQADDTPLPSGGFRNDPAYSRACERLEEIEKQNPVDWDAALSRVEALLPPDQAAKGRVNINKNRIDRAARIARRELMLAATTSAETALIAQIQAKAEIANARHKQISRQVTVNEAISEAKKQIKNRDFPPEVRRKIQATLRAAQEKLDGQQKLNQQNKALTGNLDRWESFTRDFVARHDLTSPQRAAALSIMKQLRSRAEQLELAHHNHRNRPNTQADDPKMKKARLSLDHQIERLFGQLEQRLNSLLTSKQRRAMPKSPAVETTAKKPAA